MLRHGQTSRNPYLLMTAISGFVFLSAYINLYTPDSPWRIGIGITVFSASIGFLLQYILRNLRQSVLFSAATFILLVLRASGLRSPLYAALLLTTIIAFETFWRRT